jgi:signal transduction histidine kinase
MARQHGLDILRGRVRTLVAEAVEAPRPAVVRFFGVAVQPRTYLQLLYMLTALVRGGSYLVVLLVGAALGATLIWVGVGLFVLLACLVLAWIFAIVERELVIHLLGVDVAPLSVPAREPVPPFRRLVNHLRQGTTWRSLGYLMLLVPFGAFAGMVSVVPVVLGVAIVQALFHILTTPNPFDWVGDLLLIVIGGCAGVAVLHLTRWLGNVWGGFAAATLGVDAVQRRAWEAERRAEEAERGRRQLILNVSHELRTPVANIRGHLDSVLLPPPQRPPEAERERYIAVAASEARRLGQLVDELLMLARADAEGLAVTVRVVELSPILESVVAALAPLARRERRVTVVITPGDGDLRASADPDRLAQVVTNLVRNAITHTPEGGAVSVRAVRAGPHAVISVSDTGAGIAPEELGRVFERFYRTDASRTRDSGGFGLGLAIAKDLVEAMGGTISVTSEVGLGSTFHIYLRLA